MHQNYVRTTEIKTEKTPKAVKKVKYQIKIYYIQVISTTKIHKKPKICRLFKNQIF